MTVLALPLLSWLSAWAEVLCTVSSGLYLLPLQNASVLLPLKAPSLDLPLAVGYNPCDYIVQH